MLELSLIISPRSTLQKDKQQIITTLYNACSVHQGDITSTFGNMLNILGDVQYIGGEYHDSCGEIS